MVGYHAKRAALAFSLLVAGWVGFGTSSANVPAAPSTVDARSESYLFNVYYNGKRIGEHEFRVLRNDSEIHVYSEANFVVRLLFVPVYRYEHVAEERWQSGCLQSLAASTNDNGEYFEVSMQPNQDQLLLSVLAPSASTVPLADSCPASYAYWDLDLLRRNELINSQTGAVIPARLIDRGVEELDGIAARRFTLDAQSAGVIDLWYRESDSAWIALETVRDGGTLSYRTEA